MAEPETEVVKMGQNMDPVDRACLKKTLEAVKEATEGDPEEDPEEDPADEEQEKKPCPHCGYVEGKQTPSREDMEEYMRSILGGRRFRKKYELMKGQVEVCFQTVDTLESERMNTVITKLAVVEDPIIFRAHLTKLQLVYLLATFKIGENVAELKVSDITDTDGISEEFLKRFGKLDESVVGMFVQALNLFIELKSLLVNECFDKTFYKGAGPF